MYKVYLICLTSLILFSCSDSNHKLFKDFKYYIEQKKYKSAAKVLDDLDVNYYQKNKKGEIKGGTAFLMSCQTGNKELFDKALSKKPDFTILDSQGRSALHLAVVPGNIDIVKILIDNGLDINLKDRLGWAVCHTTVASNNVDALKLLIEKKVDLKQLTKLNESVLSIGYSSAEIVDILLEQGLDLEHKDNNGNTPFARACQYADLDAIKNLIKHKANFKSLNNKGLTPLSNLAQSISTNEQRLKALKLFKSEGIPLNQIDGQGRTALHYSIRGGSLDILNFLLESSIDVNTQDKYGYSALHIAAEYSKKICQILIDHKAGINLMTIDGDTALHKAVYVGNEDIIKYLLKNGANPKIKNKNGKKPINNAMEERILALFEQ